MTLGNKRQNSELNLTRCLHRWSESAISGPFCEQPLPIPKPIFRLLADYNERSSILSLKVQNQCQLVLTLRCISISSGPENKPVNFFIGVLRMVPGYQFEYEKKFQRPSGLSCDIQFLAQLTGTDCELRELAALKFLKPRELRGIQLSLKPLPRFPVPDFLSKIHSNGYTPCQHYTRCATLWLDRYQRYRKTGLNVSNYIDHMRQLNQIDEHHMQQEMDSYTIHNAILRPTDYLLQYELSIDQFAVPPALLDVGNYVQVTSTPRNRRGKGGRITRGIIRERKAVLILEMEIPLPVGQSKLKVQFRLSRLQYQLEYHALECLHRIDYSTVAFPSLANQTVKKEGVLMSKKHTKFDWFQWQIGTNKLQQQAIANIINRTAYPAPYVLFGPPGTGKTSTIVEAVLQIYKLQPGSRILVTASSNFACNELTSRLLKFVPPDDIYRHMSISSQRDINAMDLEILAVSNMHRGQASGPSMGDFVQTRILVCTTTTSGRLVQLGVKTSIYDYIFIDECGSAKELSALVPIACIGTSPESDKLHASVVIAGDPKQLGPVTRFARLKNTCHSMSLLERMMELPYYKKDFNNNQYNTNVVMKLLDNYRSHRSLFKFSNHEFYEGELRAKASEASTGWAVGWKRLPNPKFPLLFHTVVGYMQQDALSLSYMNHAEAKVVYQYVEELLKDGINGRVVHEEDIGIISPYAKQVELIKMGLTELGLDTIEVGSAEQFQGREKPVIIVSTVRSNRTTLGFLANPKRLNVVMTRAMALTILIGNPKNLSMDPTWYSLLKFLKNNKAFTGRRFSLSSSAPSVSQSSSSTFTLSSADFA